MDVAWWHWLALGLILIALEMAIAGGFYIIFFGVAAVIIGTLVFFGIAGALWTQTLLFSALSITALLLFRRPLMSRMRMDNSVPGDMDTLVGDTAIAVEFIGPGEVGRAELRGTSWTARNHAGVPIVRGQRCIVVAVDRLTIVIQPEGVRP